MSQRGSGEEVGSGESLRRGADPEVYRVVNPTGRSPFVLTCDHAGRALPAKLGTLGLSEQELESHIAYDLGIAELGLALATRLDAFLILQAYSRLVIDANRPLESPDSIATRSEYARIAGNERLTTAAAAQRAREFFAPYHGRIRAELDRRAQAGRTAVLVALHSFTPTFLGAARAWHAGVLYGRDPRLGRALLAELRCEHGLVIGDNEPYSVSDATDYTIVVHGEQRGIAHVELEFRQDLIGDDQGRAVWVERIAASLERCFARLFPA